MFYFTSVHTHVTGQGGVCSRLRFVSPSLTRRLWLRGLLFPFLLYMATRSLILYVPTSKTCPGSFCLHVGSRRSAAVLLSLLCYEEFAKKVTSGNHHFNCTFPFRTHTINQLWWFLKKVIHNPIRRVSQMKKKMSSSNLASYMLLTL